MNLDVTPDMQVFQDEVRTFFAREFPAWILEKNLRGDRLTRADQIAAQQALQAKGWLGVSWPKVDGGPGWTPLQRYLFDVELERAGAPNLIPMGIIYIGPILSAFGTDAQKQKWLPDILNSKSFWAQGYSEPESGSDLASLALSATRDGDDYILNGEKIWTSDAHQADWIFCLARTSREARKQDGISMICADLRTPGIAVHNIPMIDGSRDLNRVSFTNVRVPADQRIGEEGKGWHYANILLKNERLSYAHIGSKRRDLARLRKLAAEMPAGGGKSMAQDTGFMARLTRCEMQLDLIEMTILRALASDIDLTTAAMLKIACTQCAQEITALFNQLAGSYSAAFLDRSRKDWPSQAPHVPDFAAPAMQSYLFERAQTIYGGATEIQKNIIWRTISG